MTDTAQRWLSTAQVAAELGVSLRTVQRYADKNRLRVARVLPTGYRQFDPADVAALRAQIYAGSR
jgi:excisionase family DNA binding protein